MLVASGTSSLLVAGSLLGARFEAFVAPPKGLSRTLSFSLADFFRGRPLLAPEGFTAPLAWTGVFGSDDLEDDLPVDVAFAVTTFLFVCAMGWEVGVGMKFKFV
jgi:hypothetical protein